MENVFYLKANEVVPGLSIWLIFDIVDFVLVK